MASQGQSITPYIVVSNASEALDYYQSCMDAKILERKETEDSKIIHSSFRLPNGAQVMMCDDMSSNNPSTKSTSRILPKGQLSPVSLSLYFDTFEAGSSFWNNFTKKNNVKDIEIHLEFSPQFWQSNFGQFTDKYGHMWQVSCPLRENEKAPQNPFQFKPNSNNSNNGDNYNQSKTKKNSSTSTSGIKRRTIVEEKWDDCGGESNDMPPKKRQKRSVQSVVAVSNNDGNTGGVAAVAQTGFKEIARHVMCFFFFNVCCIVGELLRL